MKITGLSARQHEQDTRINPLVLPAIYFPPLCLAGSSVSNVTLQALELIAAPLSGADGLQSPPRSCFLAWDWGVWVPVPVLVEEGVSHFGEALEVALLQALLRQGQHQAQVRLLLLPDRVAPPQSPDLMIRQLAARPLQQPPAAIRSSLTHSPAQELNSDKRPAVYHTITNLHLIRSGNWMCQVSVNLLCRPGSNTKLFWIQILLYALLSCLVYWNL